MTENFRWLAGVIATHRDRTVFGRTRLQKTVLLLQQKGMATGYNYSIYFYGPYSEGLSSDIGLLEMLGLVEEEARQSEKNGNKYYLIRACPEARLPEMEPFREVISRIERTDDIPLELAATFSAYFEMYGDREKAMKGLKLKKGTKCSPQNLEDAMALLTDLHLPAAQ